MPHEESHKSLHFFPSHDKMLQCILGILQSTLKLGVCFFMETFPVLIIPYQYTGKTADLLALLLLTKWPLYIFLTSICCRASAHCVTSPINISADPPYGIAQFHQGLCVPTMSSAPENNFQCQGVRVLPLELSTVYFLYTSK